MVALLCVIGYNDIVCRGKCQTKSELVMGKVDILGVKFDKITLEGAVDRAISLLADDARGYIVVTPNPEMVMATRQNSEFMAALNQANICLPDGVGVVIASRWLGERLEQRVPGIDFVNRLLQEICARGQACRVYLLGAKPGVALRAGEKLRTDFPNMEIVGARDGYFTHEQEAAVVEEISTKKPDILLVGLGFPRQELFISRNRDKLLAKLSVGCGGTLDVFAGDVTRAPSVFQRLGLEWLYRLLRQPTRLLRMMALPHFAIEVLIHRYRRLKT